MFFICNSYRIDTPNVHERYTKGTRKVQQKVYKRYTKATRKTPTKIATKNYCCFRQNMKSSRHKLKKGSLPASAEAGSDNGNRHAVPHALVHQSTEDDVRVRVDVSVDHLRRRVDLPKGYVTRASRTCGGCFVSLLKKTKKYSYCLCYFLLFILYWELLLRMTNYLSLRQDGHGSSDFELGDMPLESTQKKKKTKRPPTLLVNVRMRNKSEWRDF